jgi:uncharacterized protein YndB with AHSA1/START domain
MAKVKASVRIDRPIAEVFAYATTVDTLPQWLGAVEEVEQLTEGPLGVGTRIRAAGKMLGRRLITLVEVTALEPGYRFAFTGVTGPFTAHNSYTFEVVAGGTKVTDTAESELRGPIRLIDPLVGRMMHRQFEANLASLKDHLETRVASEG